MSCTEKGTASLLRCSCQNAHPRAPLVAQWQRVLPANAGDVGLIPSLGRPHVPPSNCAHVPQLLSLNAATPEVGEP